MKTAIWILSIVTAILVVSVYMQWKTIQKLAPAAGTSGNNSEDGLASFADQVSAVQKQIKDIEIKATF